MRRECKLLKSQLQAKGLKILRLTLLDEYFCIYTIGTRGEDMDLQYAINDLKSEVQDEVQKRLFALNTPMQRKE